MRTTIAVLCVLLSMILSAEEPESVTTLLEKVNSGDVMQRIEAVRSLGKNKQAANEIVPVLNLALRRQSDKLHVPILDALSELGPTAKAALPSIAGFLFEKNPETKAAAERVLNALGIKREMLAVELAECLKSTDETEIELTCVALSKLGKDASSAIPALQPLLKSSSSRVRRIALYAIERMGPAANSTIDAQIALLKDSDMYVRCRAASALAQLGKDAMPAKAALVEALKEKENSNVRNQAAYALTKLVGPEDKDLAPTFLALIYDPSTWCFVPQLIKSADPDPKVAVPLLVDALKGVNPNTRSLAASVLYRMGPKAEEATPALITALNDSDANVRRNVIDALVAMKNDQGKEAATLPLVYDLGDDNKWRRDQALRSLQQLNVSTDDVLKHLGAMLKNIDQSVRGRAVFALKEFGPSAKGTVPAICSLLREDNATLRQWAYEALERIDAEELASIENRAAKNVLNELADTDSNNFAKTKIEYNAKSAFDRLLTAKGRTANQIVWTMAAFEEDTVGFLKQIPLVESPAAKQISELIEKLDSDDFNTRENATAELKRLNAAVPALKKLLLGKPSLEAESRAKTILATLTEPEFVSMEELRRARLIAALRRMPGDEAKVMIDKISP